MEGKALLIFNPNAGSEETGVLELTSRAREALPELILEVFETSGERDEESLRRKLKASKYELILIAGGDGTVKLAAACAWEHCPMAILPMGSANGLARCLGINSLEDAWDALARMETVSMDGVMIGDHLCLHLADFGFNANLVHRFEEGDSRGMVAYIKSSLAEIFSTQLSQFVLEYDGERTEIEAHMLVIANGDRYGTGAVINPEGELSDGWFEVIAVQVLDAEDLIRLSMGLISGEKIEGKSFRTWTLKSCKIRNLSGAKFQIDGELMGTPSEITVGIEPGIFRFVRKTADVEQDNDLRVEKLDS
jgi:diacylglycerol kinase (ATP)